MVLGANRRRRFRDIDPNALLRGRKPHPPHFIVAWRTPDGNTRISCPRESSSEAKATLKAGVGTPIAVVVYYIRIYYMNYY